MYNLVKNMLFGMEPERAHYFTMNNLRRVLRVPGVRKSVFRKFRGNSKPVQVAGLTFPNKVGMAAGFDKNGTYVEELTALGFGHIEVGTVTPLPQPGNDQPRLFRLIDDKALINRMGFNNEGVEALAGHLEKAKQKNLPVIIGANIGKNKVTPNERAVDDYRICFSRLYDLADYFTVNVSSPNTPGLRELQDKGPLLEILHALVEIREERILSGSPKRPVFLKIAPDLTNSQLDDIVSIILESGIEGVVATNTTISREGLRAHKDDIAEAGAGGLSGKPVRDRSTEVLRYLNQRAMKKFVLIGVGGIHSVRDAKEKLQAGASLVQLYTGFIYEGPNLVKEINNAL